MRAIVAACVFVSGCAVLQPPGTTPKEAPLGHAEVRSEPVTRRVPGPGQGGFARGQRLRLKLDDAPFENGRMFLFSAVLEHFLGEFATVNSFVECSFESPQEGVFAQWPPRLGQRRNI